MGGLLDWGLYGVLAVQICVSSSWERVCPADWICQVVYFTNFPDDNRFTKLTGALCT